MCNRMEVRMGYEPTPGQKVQAVALISGLMVLSAFCGFVATEHKWQRRMDGIITSDQAKASRIAELEAKPTTVTEFATPEQGLRLSSQLLEGYINWMDRNIQPTPTELDNAREAHDLANAERSVD